VNSRFKGCEIWESCSGVSEASCLLQCDASSRDSGYRHLTRRWRHIGTTWPQTKCHQKPRVLCLKENWTVWMQRQTTLCFKSLSFWLWWVCQYSRYVGEILECFVRAHRCCTHQYFAVRSLGTAAGNCVTDTVYLFVANVRVCVAHLVALGLSASTGFKLE